MTMYLTIFRSDMENFPTYFTGEHALSMTLRDYFAAKAMQGMFSDPDHQLGAWDNYVDWHKNLTSQAYQIADAMIKARNDS